MKYIDLSSNVRVQDIFNNAKNVEAVENSLHNIISTYKGTIPGNPEFGCKLDKFLFSLINPLVLKLIEEDVIYAVTRWERRVNIIECKAIEDLDYNRLVVKLKYSIKADVENRVYDFVYKAKLEK